jgi:crotonobetainyl-CoA:carnitine CoA-transferase CaiB-like acyl-CoA transferase
MSAAQAPLAGINVLSLAEQYPGPLCTRLLVDMGAQVIQLERPGVGDPLRASNPWLFRSCAINKKSVALDLKSADGITAAKALVEGSDVLIEGFRPGVMKRLGLGYEDVCHINQRIVYCSLSGYGQTGPYRDEVGHNINYEATSGLLDPFILPDSPYAYFPGGPPMGDIVAGCLAATGIVATLRKAEATGAGDYIDLSITDALVFGLAPSITRAMNGIPPWPDREGAYQVFQCSDGAVAIGIAHEDHFWTPLCKVLEIEEISGLDHKARVECQADIRFQIQEKLIRHSVDYWLKEFAGRVPCSAVNRVGEVLDDPQVRHRQMGVRAIDEQGEEFLTVRSPLAGHVDSQTMPGKVPSLGESTDEILATLGLSDAAHRPE